MKRHLVVFDDGSGDEIDLKVFVDSLDPGANMFTLDGHVCFLTSSLSVQDVSDRFSKISGSALFLVTDISKADCAGRMPRFFWEDLKQAKLPAAAE